MAWGRGGRADRGGGGVACIADCILQGAAVTMGIVAGALRLGQVQVALRCWPGMAIVGIMEAMLESECAPLPKFTCGSAIPNAWC